MKVHKHSGKVTFLSYDQFDSVLLPELTLRAKVNLRTRWVEVFDHTGKAELLYFKERSLRQTTRSGKSTTLADALRNHRRR